jgi:hypothetical protein
VRVSIPAPPFIGSHGFCVPDHSVLLLSLPARNNLRFVATKSSQPHPRPRAFWTFLGFNLGEESEAPAVVLGEADEVLAHLAVRADLLAELRDHLCV